MSIMKLFKRNRRSNVIFDQKADQQNLSLAEIVCEDSEIKSRINKWIEEYEKFPELLNLIGIKMPVEIAAVKEGINDYYNYKFTLVSADKREFIIQLVWPRKKISSWTKVIKITEGDTTISYLSDGTVESYIRETEEKEILVNYPSENYRIAGEEFFLKSGNYSISASFSLGMGYERFPELEKYFFEITPEAVDIFKVYKVFHKFYSKIKGFETSNFSIRVEKDGEIFTSAVFLNAKIQEYRKKIESNDTKTENFGKLYSVNINGNWQYQTEGVSLKYDLEKDCMEAKYSSFSNFKLKDYRKITKKISELHKFIENWSVMDE